VGREGALPPFRSFFPVERSKPAPGIATMFPCEVLFAEAEAKLMVIREIRKLVSTLAALSRIVTISSNLIFLGYVTIGKGGSGAANYADFDQLNPSNPKCRTKAIFGKSQELRAGASVYIFSECSFVRQ
jgi:hypothetical protein